MTALPQISHPETSLQQRLGARLGGLAARYIRLDSMVLLSLMIGILLSPLDSIRLTGAVTISDIFFFLSAALIFFFFLLGRNRLWMASSFIIGMTLLLVALGSRPFVIEGEFYRDSIGMLALFTAMFLIPWTLTNCPALDWNKVKLLFMVWIIATTLGNLAAVLQSRGISMGFMDQWLRGTSRRIAGLTMSPNTLGTTGAMVVPALLIMWLNARDARHAWAWAACAFVGLWAVNLTGSRSGIIAMVAATAALVAVQFFLVRRYRLPALRVALAFLGLLIVIAVRMGAQEGFQSESALDRLFVNDQSSEKSNYYRGILKQVSWEEFWKNPLTGHGHQYLLQAHNNFLSMMEMAGLLGLTALILHQLLIAKSVVLDLRRSAWSRERFTVALGLLGAWLIFLVSGLVQANLVSRQLFVPMGLLILLLVHPHLLGPPSAPAPEEK